MLSYQHSYHAGCLADVQKHAALATILSQLVKKEKPLTYIETHAGRGIYNLNSPESLKTKEAEQGIGKVFKSLPPGVYKELLLRLKSEQGEGFYPGSPMLAKSLLRKDDKLHLCELHPQEFAALKNNFSNFRNVFLHNEDGYKKALAISPPLIRRGIVVIDPSYEIKTEYAQAADFILKLHKKWPEATILLWYPILADSLHKEVSQRILTAGLPKTWLQEVNFETGHGQRAIGSGLIAVNMPYGIDEELDKIAKLFQNLAA